MNKNEIITELINFDELKKRKEKIISELKPKPVPKIPLIKKLWYKYLSSKRKNTNNNYTNVNTLKRVLIFRYDAIGDYFTTTPIISFLRKNNPNLVIDVVASARNENIIKSDINVNNVYVIDFKNQNTSITKKSIKLMKQNNYDIIFAFVFNKNTKAAELSYKISPSAHKVAFSAPNKKELYLQIFDTVITSYYFEFHYSEQMFQCIKKLFGEQNLIENYPIYIPLNQANIDNAIEFAKENNLEYSPYANNVVGISNIEKKLYGIKYVIINLTGFGENKNLNKENALKLAKYLVDKYPQIHFFITGDPNKKEFISNIVNQIDKNNCSGLFQSLSNYIAILIGACLLISPDTATVHIAAASKVPLVGIYISGDNIFNWYPFSTEFTIINGYYLKANHKQKLENINLIDFDKVIETAELYLNRYS